MMLDLLVAESNEFAPSLPSSLVAVPTFVPPTSPPPFAPFTLGMIEPADPPPPPPTIGILSPTFMPSAPIPVSLEPRPTLQQLIINEPWSSAFSPGLPRTMDNNTESPARSGMVLLALAAAAYWLLD